MATIKEPIRILLGFIAFGLFSLITYFMVRNNPQNLAIWKYVFWTIFAVCVMAATWKMISYLRENPLAGKEVVSSDRALELWKDTAMQRWHIPHSISHEMKDLKGKPLRVPHNPNAIHICNETDHVKSLTGQRFLAFQADIFEGDRQGSMFVYISTDQGEKHIRENFNARVKDHRTFNTFEIDEKSFPMVASAEKAERAQLEKIRLAREEGLSATEIAQLMPEPTPAQTPARRNGTITKPEISEEMPELTDEEAKK